MKINDIIGYEIDDYKKYNIGDKIETNKIIGIVVNKKWYSQYTGLKCMLHVKVNYIKHKGRLIEFEGIDGSGKTTYIKKLNDYLISKNKKVKIYDFPQYNTYIGELIAKYLRGEYGDIESIPQEILNILFASDRVSIQNELKNYLDEGYYVLLNRYTYSNIFQMAKMKENKINILEDLEFNTLNIIKPDDVVYLTLSIEEVKNRLEKRKNKEYQNNKEDIHENNLQLLKDVDDLYKDIANKKEWIIINEDNLNIDEIFELIKNKLKL